MKSISIILVLIVALTGCSRKTPLPDLGVLLPPDAKRIENSLIMTGPSSMVPEYQLVRGNTTFALSIDEDSSVNYISTLERLFETTDGVKIGTPLHQVLALSGTEIEALPGRAFFVKLPSGWNAAFTQGVSMTEGTLDNNAEVKFLFKSNQVQ